MDYIYVYVYHGICAQKSLPDDETSKHFQLFCAWLTLVVGVVFVGCQFRALALGAGSGSSN